MKTEEIVVLANNWLRKGKMELQVPILCHPLSDEKATLAKLLRIIDALETRGWTLNKYMIHPSETGKEARGWATFKRKAGIMSQSST